MLDFSVTFLLTVVNVTFLYFVLRRVLFKPVTKFMEDRTNAVQKDLDAAKRAATRAEALEAEFAAKMKTVQEESQAELVLRRETADLSILAASRILGENLDSDTNRALVEKFLSSVGVA